MWRRLVCHSLKFQLVSLAVFGLTSRFQSVDLWKVKSNRNLLACSIKWIACLFFANLTSSSSFADALFERFAISCRRFLWWSICLKLDLDAQSILPLFISNYHNWLSLVNVHHFDFRLRRYCALNTLLYFAPFLCIWQHSVLLLYLYRFCRSYDCSRCYISFTLIDRLRRLLLFRHYKNNSLMVRLDLQVSCNMENLREVSLPADEDWYFSTKCTHCNEISD